MLISLDTNIWIFGITGLDPFCEKILLNLSQFEIIIPNRIRGEVERNLSFDDMKQFYRFVLLSDTQIDYEKVPSSYITHFDDRGLKKGDSEIGAFCEWRKVDILVSDNRDFLKALPVGQQFLVISPKAFCEAFGL